MACPQRFGEADTGMSSLESVLLISLRLPIVRKRKLRAASNFVALFRVSGVQFWYCIFRKDEILAKKGLNRRHVIRSKVDHVIPKLYFKLLMHLFPNKYFEIFVVKTPTRPISRLSNANPLLFFMFFVFIGRTSRRNNTHTNTQPSHSPWNSQPS